MESISKEELNNFINRLIRNSTYEVHGVQSKGDRYVFAPLESIKDLRLDYDVTILPPKKYFLPPYEKMMDFKLKEDVTITPTHGGNPRIIIGVHPYDIAALEQTDRVYLDDQKDDFYEQRRKNTIIIGVDIQNVSKHSFAGSLGTHVVESGFDIMLTNIGKKYVVTIGSEKGKELLNRYAKTNDATKNDIEMVQKMRNKTLNSYNKHVQIKGVDEWSSLLVANYENNIWEKLASKCMQCSSCTMVCPTCFCYDVRDEVFLDVQGGSRIRTWDGCLLEDFTKVAGGEIFREGLPERYRHRFFRKGNYLAERYGFIACVGCGRCSIACLPDIASPCDVINELTQCGGKGKPDKYFIQQTKPEMEKGIIHVPRTASIREKKNLTESETLFTLEFEDKRPLGHTPGQFVELSIYGVGEAPFGVSSPPSDDTTFDVVVRKVGNLTSKLFTLENGDKVGIRGPLGNGFDINEFEGKHIIFVSGGTGMIPMRSLIEYCLDTKNRNKFKHIKILYGAKRPSDVLFQDKIALWEQCDDVSCKLTVDTCQDGECWVGSVGLVTALFPKLEVDRLDPKNTKAVVIGPPVMFKFVIKCLQTIGINDKDIFVSLERRMKCGVGKCGHCQINGVYCCKEGPVFNYAEIKELPEAFE